jgi:hypothetical protein
MRIRSQESSQRDNLHHPMRALLACSSIATRSPECLDLGKNQGMGGGGVLNTSGRGAGALSLELELCGTGEGDTSSDLSAEPASEGAGRGP